MSTRTPIMPVAIMAGAIVAFLLWIDFAIFPNSPSGIRNPLTWRTYRNTDYAVSFSYPASWRLIRSTGDGDTIPLVQSDDRRCGLTGCYAIAGVDTFSVSVSRLPLAGTVGTWQQPLTKVTLGPNVVYLTDVVQGIEDRFQTALLDDNGWTLLITASGQKLVDLPRLLASVTITSVACTQEAQICSDGSAVGRRGPQCRFDDCAVNGTNTNTTSNTNTAKPTATNTNTTIPTNTNTNTGTVVNPPSMTYTIGTLTANPVQFDNESACLRGWYQSSFEFSALGPAVEQNTAGESQLVEPYIWIDNAAELTAAVTCDTAREGQRTCLGEIRRVCGIFRYAAPGERGFGQSADYRYALDDANVVSTGTMENSNGN